jgi:NAD(P)-dependent dehydrogenase (short-subunit alcohol dehydrogenase family)
MGVTTDIFDLSGQVALLTGASKGMGRCMAIGLAKHGSKVVVSSRKADQCQEVVDEINEQ